MPSCWTATPLTTLGLNFHFLIALKADESKTLGEMRVWMSRWGGGMKIWIEKSRWGEGMIGLGEVTVWFLGEVRVWSLGEPRWARKKYFGRW